MANNLKMANAAVNEQADRLGALLSGGTINLYGGTQPATADTTSGSSVLAVTLNFGTPAFASAVGGVMLAAYIAPATASASVDPVTWFRAKKSDGTAVMDGSVGTASCDLNLNSTNISIGAVVTISNFQHTVTK